MSTLQFIGYHNYSKLNLLICYLESNKLFYKSLSYSNVILNSILLKEKKGKNMKRPI